MRIAITAALVVLLAPAAAGAQDPPLDTRIYNEALEALEAGRTRDGARLLRRVYTEFPSSRHAPDALLRVAGLIYPASSWDGIGRASERRVQEAGKLLDRIVRQHRDAPEAPRALVKLGYLALEPANPEWDLDGACARFATCLSRYPESDATADALFGSGMCELLRGEPARAAAAFRRLADEIPASPLIADALLRHGEALSRLDPPGEAMIALQEVRSRFPGSEQAARALDRLTLLHRMRVLPSQAPPSREGPASSDRTSLYQLDRAYGPPAGREDSAAAIRGSSDIAIDAEGRAIVASRKSPGVFRLDPTGAVQDRIDHPGPEYIALDEGRAVYISGRDQIAVNTRNWSGPELTGLDGRQVRKFGPIALDHTGRLYLIDPGEDALLIFNRNRQLVGHVRPPAGREGRFVDVATGDDGAVYVLDGRARMVVVLRQGRVIGRVPLSALGIGEPIALAVDALGDLFLLDERTGWIFVTDPAGHRIDVVRPPREAVDRLGDPAALALDPQGRIYLCGRKSGRVVRFR